MENNHTEQTGISGKLLAFNAILVFFIGVMIFVISSPVQTVLEKKEAKKTPPSTAFDNLDLEAKSAYVFDIQENKVLYKKNEFVQLPLASITKLMMAMTASDLIPKDSKITIRKEFLATEGDSGLLANESWVLSDLLDFSLLVSSNDGARSIASVVGAFDLKSTDYTLGRKEFIEKMNVKARELGLRQTYFINESGLDEGNMSGGYGSAIDVAKLMQYILEHKPELLEATKYQNIEISSLNKKHSAENTNTSVENIPGLLASKTGFTDMAGGNLVIAFDASIGRPIVVVVLGSNINDRFSDVLALVKASLEYIRD